MKKKIRLGLLFGGRSGEHEVSLTSAASVLKALDPDKYEVVPIGITREGRWLVGSSADRLLPGVLAGESTQEESHTSGLLEYPHYTRPPEFRGWRIPEVLLSGHHEQIARWRRKESLRLTRARRPELFAKVDVSSKGDVKLLKELEEEEE